MLKGNYLSNMRLFEQVFGNYNLIVKCQVIHLEESGLDSHLGLSMLLDKLYDLVDLRHRVVKEVDTLQAFRGLISAASHLNSLLDLDVSAIVFVVEIGELDQRDPGLEHIQVELIKEFHRVVNQEEQLVLVIYALQIVNTA